MTLLPDRILVYGVTGSGKSTAAPALGRRTGVPVTLVDELTWLPGWVPVDSAVQRELMRSWAASADGPEVLLFRGPRELAEWLGTLESAR